MLIYPLKSKHSINVVCLRSSFVYVG